MPDMQPSRSFPILPDDVELWLLWLLALGALGLKAIHHAPTSAPTNGPSWGPSLPGPKSYDHARPIVFGTPTFFLSCASLPRLVFHSTHYCSISLFAKKHPLPLVRAPIQTILPRLCPHPQPSQVFLHLPRWRKSRSSSATCCVSTAALQLRAQALTVVFYPHSRSWSEHVRVSTPPRPSRGWHVSARTTADHVALQGDYSGTGKPTLLTAKYGPEDTMLTWGIIAVGGCQDDDGCQ